MALQGSQSNITYVFLISKTSEAAQFIDDGGELIEVFENNMLN